MLEKIEEQIISAIKGKKIKPRAKVWFSLKRLAAWLLAGAFILLGAVAVSMLITVLRFGDFDIYRLVSQNIIVFVILVFPYFWLALYLFFLFFSFYRLRHSQYGYRYQKIWLWLAFFLTSLVLGIAMEGIGLGRNMENYLADNFPAYAKVNYMRGIWNNPNKGMLSGEVVSLSNTNLILQDFSEASWTVFLGNAKIDPMAQLIPGSKIKLVGEVTGSGKFLAKEIKPWGCGCSKCQSMGSECGCGSGGSCMAGSCSK